MARRADAGPAAHQPVAIRVHLAAGAGGGFERFCLAGEREYVLTEDGNVHACELVGRSSETSGRRASTSRGSGRGRRRGTSSRGSAGPSAGARTSAHPDDALLRPDERLPVLGAMVGLSAPPAGGRERTVTPPRSRSSAAVRRGGVRVAAREAGAPRPALRDASRAENRRARDRPLAEMSARTRSGPTTRRTPSAS